MQLPEKVDSKTRDGSEKRLRRTNGFEFRRQEMALFGDEDHDVGPFVMAEGGEEWFPFTLDNLEMDRACSSAQDDARPMDQVRQSLAPSLCRILLFSWGHPPP